MNRCIHVKLKVSHLLRKLKQIDRDLNELNSLQEKIRNDRSYSVRVIESLSAENKRINKLKEQIFSQTIVNPADLNRTNIKSTNSEAPALNVSKNSKLKPEIILPEIITSNKSDTKRNTTGKDETNQSSQLEKKDKLNNQVKYKFKYTR